MYKQVYLFVCSSVFLVTLKNELPLRAAVVTAHLYQTLCYTKIAINFPPCKPNRHAQVLQTLDTVFFNISQKNATKFSSIQDHYRHKHKFCRYQAQCVYASQKHLFQIFLQSGAT